MARITLITVGVLVLLVLVVIDIAGGFIQNDEDEYPDDHMPGRPKQ